MQGRQFSTSRTLNQQLQQQQQHSPPPPPPQAGYTRLTNRSLISISGVDSPAFLQGLTTQNVLAPKGQSLPKSAFYTAFLNSQGRVLNDAFIYPYLPTDNSASSTSDPAYLIEVDTSEVKNLLKHFRKHKLRSKLTYRALDEGERSVWALWDENKTTNWIKHLAGKNEHGIASVDHRAPGLGYRLISPGSDLQGLKDSLPGDEAGLSSYTVRRILHGVAEGQGEIVRESSLPMDSNMDAMEGIDFHKGCYLGQELTIRTHHRGVIRKRILPVQMYGLDDGKSSSGGDGGLEYSPDTALSLPPPGANISKLSGRRGRSAGKFLTGIGNVGLAVCRLEVMTDIALTGESTQYDPEQEFNVLWDEDAEGSNGKAGAANVKAFVPPWLREYISSGGAKHRVSRREGQRAKDMVEQLEEEERQEKSDR